MITPLSVLLASRVDLFGIKGGDTVQIQKIKEYLEKISSGNIAVSISTELEPSLEQYDIVHLFNISPRIHDTFLQARNAVRHKKPYVLTPIYHNQKFIDEYDKAHRYGMLKILNYLLPSLGSREIAKNIFRAMKDPRQKKAVFTQIKTGYRKQQRYALLNASFLITQSEEEAHALKRDFGIKKPFAVAPLGIDLPHNQNMSPHQALARLHEYILCVGRIETRKNQLGIIHALKQTNLSLVFAGAVNPHHQAYFKKIMAEIKRFPKIIYLPAVPHEEVGRLFSHAKVHVNASFYESTPHPFVSLEAAACACNVVETIKGYADDELKKYFEYCDPFSAKSIKNAVLKAYQKPKNPALAEHVRAAYSWEKAVSEIISVYKNVLS
ncbi:MAG: Glycosyl transferase group 1 [Parcubacteria group bacterium GW2011_GWA2_44_12]|nr:MAG: Glycosyl transferase group 1 [Parcubacteria group bacterium GW2011_GWA2_44_12]